MSADRHFDANRIFYGLFVLTALEVLWGYAFGLWLDPGKVVLWGGLIGFALWKGLLIANYFMHLKFEGWVIKGLIFPTPFLILVIFGYVVPDVADKDGPMMHPIGSAYDPLEGDVVEHMTEQQDRREARGEGAESEADGH